MAPLLWFAYIRVYMCMYILYRSLCKYYMSDIPIGVLLLYTRNPGPYAQRSYSTTAREFVASEFLHPKQEFKPMAPLLDRTFQVDKKP